MPGFDSGMLRALCADWFGPSLLEKHLLLAGQSSTMRDDPPSRKGGDPPVSHRGPIAKILAVILVVAVQWLFVPTAAGPKSATLAGTIYAFDGEQPVDGAILHAGDMRTGEIYSSAATNSDGIFVLSDLPPAAYELAVEKDGGLYLVGAPLQLAPGQKRDVQVAIHPETVPDVAPDPKTVSEEKENREMDWLDNPLFASLVVIGVSILFGALISTLDESDEGIASPFTTP
ncbi:MAG: carboxypeptidase regulatory-like domain-containing protein [Acidobacteria bacterium]|nr:MAG: carboxypeptidase regulatory-like domain-containing protein [Acidobacteriota bacterium]